MSDADRSGSPEPASRKLPLSRREFMRIVGLTAGGSLLAACQQQSPQAPTASQGQPAAPAAAPTAVPTFARPQTESAPAAAASPAAAAPTAAAAAPAPALPASASGSLTIVQGVDIVTVDPPKSVSLTDQ